MLAIEWERIFTMAFSKKVLIPRICKELLKINQKKGKYLKQKTDKRL